MEAGSGLARSARRHRPENRFLEAAVGLTKIVPFLVEDELRKKGGKYSQGLDWESHTVSDGNLITGQNPASSEAAARSVLAQL